MEDRSALRPGKLSCSGKFLALDDRTESVAHEVARRVDKVGASDVALVVPRPKVVRTNGVPNDEDVVSEVLTENGCRDDAD